MHSLIGHRPQFAVFQLDLEDLLASRDLAGRGIIIASWLAAEARKELSRFREFIHWLRFGASFL